MNEKLLKFIENNELFKNLKKPDIAGCYNLVLISAISKPVIYKVFNKPSFETLKYYYLEPYMDREDYKNNKLLYLSMAVKEFLGFTLIGEACDELLTYNEDSDNPLLNDDLDILSFIRLKSLELETSVYSSIFSNTDPIFSLDNFLLSLDENKTYNPRILINFVNNKNSYSCDLQNKNKILEDALEDEEYLLFVIKRLLKIIL